MTESKSKSKTKLSPKLQTLFQEFDSAAQSHGWESDQGSFTSSYEAAARYNAAKEALHDHLLKLEGDRRRAINQRRQAETNLTLR